MILAGTSRERVDRPRGPARPAAGAALAACSTSGSKGGAKDSGGLTIVATTGYLDLKEFQRVEVVTTV